LKSGVTNRQIVFILLLTLTSYSVVDISRAMAASAGYGSWFTLLITSIIFSAVGIIVVSLANMYKGQMMHEYSCKLIGNFGGYAVSIYYVVYFSLIVVFLGLQLATILKADFFPKTPKAAILLAGIPVFCFIAYKGITALARLFEMIGMFYIVVGTTVHVIMFTQGNPNYILPLFNKADIGNYFAAIKDAIFPFLGIEILLIIPFSKENGKKSIITTALTVFAIGLFYILIVESCIMKLGMNDIVHYNSSIIVAIRDMELPFLDFMKRLDVLFLTVGFMGFFLGITIVYTAITEYLCRIFKNAKRMMIVIVLGALSFAACLILDTVEGFSDFVTSVGIYLGIGAGALIPGLLLIIAKRRKDIA